MLEVIVLKVLPIVIGLLALGYFIPIIILLLQLCNRRRNG